MDELTKTAMRKWTLVQPGVSAFVLSVVRDPSDRDDVLQEIAISVVESFSAYDPQRPFQAWAMGVARNQVKMFLRKRGRDRLVFDDQTIAALETAFVQTERQQSQKMSALQDCLALVQGRAKLLCQMRYQDDHKPAAIAEMVGMSTDAVRKALQRVRDNLRQCINDKAEGVA